WSDLVLVEAVHRADGTRGRLQARGRRRPASSGSPRGAEWVARAIFPLRRPARVHVPGSPADGARKDDPQRAPGDGAVEDFDGLFDGEDPAIERAVLNETEEGRRIQAAYVAAFGEFVRAELRPTLRDVAHNGGQPQLLVNGLADLLRSVAD